MTPRCLFLSSAIAAALVLTGAAQMPASANEYVVACTPRVNIRTGPSTDRVVVGQAEKGDVFILAGETRDWFAIRMFSDEVRYISKGASSEPPENCAARFCAKLTQAELLPGHGLTPLPAEDTRRLITTSIRHAIARAEREATEILPASVDERRHALLRGILEDRLVLEVLRIHGVPPAVFDEIVAGDRSHPQGPRDWHVPEVMWTSDKP